jgi:acetylornithine deacetylase/succinyl-diaminopimelate desuccinylase-like protein
MADREDPLVRAADLVTCLWQAVLGHGPQAVVNFGVIDVCPGSYNVIPQEVRLGVEIRSDQAAILAELDAFLRTEVALREGQVVAIGQDAPVALSVDIRQIILEAASRCGVTCQEMPSWAGHDAAIFAAQTPTGMIFVPSVAGASHCPQELTLETDVQAGLDLLLATICDADTRLS